jgi:hypothetical protein
MLDRLQESFMITTPMVKRTLLVVAGWSVVGMSAPARAVSFGSGPITLDGLTYSNFDLESPDGITPGELTITQLTDGLRITGPFAGPLGTTISYDVSGADDITDARLGFYAYAPSDTTMSEVAETLSGDGSGTISVLASGQTYKDTNNLTFPAPVSTLHVSNDVIGLGAQQIYSFDNAFDVLGSSSAGPGGSGSTPPVIPGVPEPVSLALLPLGLAGLGLRKKLFR